MMNFVLRHSVIKVDGAILVTKLGARYVAPLSPEEAMEKQDKMMRKEDLDAH
jgi:hypothetical protein